MAHVLLYNTCAQTIYSMLDSATSFPSTHLVALTSVAWSFIPTLAFPSVNRRTDSTREASADATLKGEEDRD